MKTEVFDAIYNYMSIQILRNNKPKTINHKQHL
jgi:hypothetical protein